MAKGKGGRPCHAPTQRDRDIVELLTGFQIPQDKIARVLRISVPTMLLHYRDEIDRGAATVESNLVGSLMQLCKQKDGTGLKAIMFTLQCRFGWSQYAPAPVEISKEELGKKQLANLEAQTAHEKTSWSDLVN